MRLLRLFRRDDLAALPAIETTRLRLAPLRPGDAEALRALTDDPAITGAVDFLPERFGLEDARGLIASGRHGRDVFHGVRTRDDGALAAVVGTHLRGARAIEIGYWVGGAFRGQGYGAEAVEGLAALLARRFPRRLLVAECNPTNAASRGLLLKVGFRDTGADGHRPGRRVFVREGGA